MRLRPPRGDDRCWNTSSMPQIKYFINEKKTFSWLVETSKQTGKRIETAGHKINILSLLLKTQASGGSCTRLSENNPSAGCTSEANCLRLYETESMYKTETSFSKFFRLTRRWLNGVISLSCTAYAESQLWPRLVCWVRLNEINRGRRPRAPSELKQMMCVYGSFWKLDQRGCRFSEEIKMKLKYETF